MTKIEIHKYKFDGIDGVKLFLAVGVMLIAVWQVYHHWETDIGLAWTTVFIWVVIWFVEFLDTVSAYRRGQEDLLRRLDENDND